MKALFATALLLVFLPARAISPAIAGAAHVPSVVAAQAYGGLPLSFEINRGQTAPQVRFLVRTRDYIAFLTTTEAVLVIQSKVSPASQGLTPPPALEHLVHVRVSHRSATIRLRFDGANPRARIVGLERQPGIVNYFIGNNPKLWRTDIPTFARVAYRNIYPGVDLVFYGDGQRLEYDWVLHPGASASRIRLHVSGAWGSHVDSGGNLVLPSGLGTIVQHSPRAFQTVGTWKRTVTARYAIHSEDVSLVVGAHDARKTLTVDPVIAFATYLGGRQADSGYAIAVDSAGSAFAVGDTISPDFPTKAPLQPFHGGTGTGDTYVTKFDPTGSVLVYSTYYGGSNFDHAYTVAVDSQDQAVFAGETGSHDYPVLHPFQRFFGGGGSDGTIAKLNATGDKIVFSSYLGGSNTDAVYALAVDSAGNAYLTGSTQSKDFEIRHPLQKKIGGSADAFAAKVGPTGLLLWNTFLGGSLLDAGFGIGVDQAGNIYVAGETQSNDFPTVNALQTMLKGASDGFVTKIDPTETKILYSTHLGGNDNTVIDSLAADTSGNVYVTGQTSSSDYPMLHAYQGTYGGQSESYFPGDAFVTKLDPSGQLAYSTFLGGAYDDEARSIAVDSSGAAYVTGVTDSANFPIKDGVQPNFLGAYCRSINGAPFPCTDAFISKFEPTGQLSWSTFWGGSRSDTGTGVAADSQGNVYAIGTTESNDMQTVQAVHPQNTSTKVAADDAYVVKIAPGTTTHDNSLVIGKAQILQKVGGQQQPTTKVRSGQVTTLLLTWRDKRQGSHPAFATVVIYKGTKEVMQATLFPGGTKKNPNLSALVVFTSKQGTGNLVARFEVISLPATTAKSVHFTLSK